MKRNISKTHRRVLLVVLAIAFLIAPPLLKLALGTGTTLLGRWYSIQSPTNVDLCSVDMVSVSDGWAVGSMGTILHWDGGLWSTVPSPTTYQLRSIDMVSADDGWAVGASGTIIRWDGTSWSIVLDDDVPTDQDLHCVDVVYFGELYDVWAVGTSGTIVCALDIYSGVDFEPVESPIDDVNFWSVDMHVRVHGWFVGSKHWDGSTWKTTILELWGSYWTVVDTGPGGGVDLFSIDMGGGVPSIEGWAVGDTGTIFHWDPTEQWSWSNPTGAWLYSVDIVTADDVWAVGTSGTIMHYTITSSDLMKRINDLESNIEAKLDGWFGTGGKFSNTAQATSGSGSNTFTSSGSAILYTGTKVGTVTVSFSTTGVSWVERLVVRYYTNPAAPTVYIQKTVTQNMNTLGWTDTAAAWKVGIYFTGTGSVNWAYSIIYPP